MFVLKNTFKFYQISEIFRNLDKYISFSAIHFGSFVDFILRQRFDYNMA